MSDATTVPSGTPALTQEQIAAAKVKQNMVAGMAQKIPMAPPAAGDKERNVQLPPVRRQGREFANTDHVVTVESNWTIDDVVKPIFWSCVYQYIRQYDKISVRVDDGSWYAELLVTQRGTGYAFVRVLQYVKLIDDSGVAGDEAKVEGYEIRELGPFKKWCVIRTADAATLKEKCESRADADLWLREHQAQQFRSR